MINDLLKNNGYVVDNLLLQVWGASLPDLGWLDGHKTSLCSAMDMSSATASTVSFVAGRVGCEAARLVAETGIRNVMVSR
jgi:hypothetical protein